MSCQGIFTIYSCIIWQLFETFLWFSCVKIYTESSDPQNLVLVTISISHACLSIKTKFSVFFCGLAFLAVYQVSRTTPNPVMFISCIPRMCSLPLARIFFILTLSQGCSEPHSQHPYLLLCDIAVYSVTLLKKAFWWFLSLREENAEFLRFCLWFAIPYFSSFIFHSAPNLKYTYMRTHSTLGPHRLNHSVFIWFLETSVFSFLGLWVRSVNVHTCICCVSCWGYRESK